MKGIFLRPTSQCLRIAFGKNAFSIPSKTFGKCYLSTSNSVYQEALKEDPYITTMANTKIRSVLVANRGNFNSMYFIISYNIIRFFVGNGNLLDTFFRRNSHSSFSSMYGTGHSSSCNLFRGRQNVHASTKSRWGILGRERFKTKRCVSQHWGYNSYRKGIEKIWDSYLFRI